MKNPNAVELGKLGGKARAKLTKKELSRIGKMGGRPKIDKGIKSTPATKQLD